MNELKEKNDIKIKPNELQQKCIDLIQGQYLILAGPGTGKTFTVIERIAQMLKKGIDPSKILCLTYSDAAASEMKTRIAKKLDKLDTGVDIFTYHSFCNSIITDNFDEFELKENYKIVTNAISRQFIKECIDELNPTELRSSKNDPYVYLSIIKDRIEEIKKYGYTKEQYFDNIKYNPDWEQKIASLKEELNNPKSRRKKETVEAEISDTEKRILKAKEIWQFYELYQKKLEQNNYIDFNDMISLVLDKFKTNPVFLNKVANKYEYILVDEYQDTNMRQNEILFSIIDALEFKNIFVVGDDEQIIYTFQGAKLDIFEKFLNKYPDTKIICLKENLRSTQNILDCARNIASQDDKRLEVNPKFLGKIDKNLIAKNEKLFPKNQKVRCTRYNDLNQEYFSIVEEIKELINSPDCPKDEKGNKDLSQIAILTKSNRELAEFSNLLKQRNIPYELKDGKSIFEIKSSVILYYYLKMLVNPEINSDKILTLLLCEPFKINPLDYIKLQEKKSKNKSFIESLSEIKDFIDQEKTNNFLNTFNYLFEYKNSETLENIILEVGSKTGIFSYFINNETNRYENIQGLKKIIEEAKDFSNVYKKINLEDFVEYLDIALSDEIEILTSKAPVALNAVQLSTYHSSKGKEFEIVYMPTLMRNNWEKDTSSYKPQIPVSNEEYKTKEELDEIKRSDKIKLMYVGTTRAKHTLRLSYVLDSGKKSSSPSEFIVNIQDILELKEKEPYDLNSYYLEQMKSLKKENYDYNRDFNNLVEAKLKNKPYSPTSINTYLNCAREFLYNYVLDLSPKYEESDSLHFGSAIHYVLEKAVSKAKKEGKYPELEEIIEEFKNKLTSLSLSNAKQKEILLTRGKNALSNYYPRLISTNINSIYAFEYPLSYKHENYRFFGIADRIEKNSDGSYSIYDYKTGSAKSEKEVNIEGKYENYYNQLGLYKYFFEKSTNKKVKTTALIFVEEPDKNLYLDLNNIQIQAIVEKFEGAIENIKNYKFEKNETNSSCEYCPFKIYCKILDK